MLYIDNIIFYLQKSGGISVVWKELISRLIADKYKAHFLQYTSSPDNLFFKDLPIPTKTKIFFKLYCLFIQRYLPLQLSFVKEASLFHSTYYRYSSNPKILNITTVHDFTYEYFAKGWRARLHRWQKFRAIRHSKYIICISENTKRDLLKFMPDINPNCIRVIYNGVSDDYFPIVNIAIPSYLSRPYVVFVGAREGYKNFRFAVDALVGTKYILMIVGSPLSRTEIKYLNVKLEQNQYYYVGRVENRELNIIYNNAFALLYPSIYEGFGIPVLEAQKSGCPVIAYNASSIPEIIGDTPLLLNTLSINEVHRCFSILENATKRDLIIKKGMDNAKRYSWDIMYHQVLDLYAEAMSNI